MTKRGGNKETNILCVQAKKCGCVLSAARFFLFYLYLPREEGGGEGSDIALSKCISENRPGCVVTRAGMVVNAFLVVPVGR